MAVGGEEAARVHACMMTHGCTCTEQACTFVEAERFGSNCNIVQHDWLHFFFPILCRRMWATILRVSEDLRRFDE